MAIVRLDLQKKVVIREAVEIAMQRNRRGEVDGSRRGGGGWKQKRGRWMKIEVDKNNRGGGGWKQKRGRWMETEEEEVDENRSG